MTQPAQPLVTVVMIFLNGEAYIAEAIDITRAPLVDVSSGVESAPGVKDANKIAAFLRTIASL